MQADKWHRKGIKCNIPEVRHAAPLALWILSIALISALSVPLEVENTV